MHRFDDPSDMHAPTHELSALDMSALEALLHAEMDLARVPADMRARAQKCLEVLTMLDCGPEAVADESLADVTLLRVARMRREVSTAELHPHDEDALEALVSAGFDPSRCPAGLRSRAEQHVEMLSSLDVAIAHHDRESRISETLSFVQSTIDTAHGRMAINEGRRNRSSWRLSDLVSVAALLLVSTAVLAPMVGAMRGMSQSASCQAGMLGTMRGFSGYAGDYRDALPMASPSPAGAKWWNIGTPRESNSANLYTMIRTNHAQTADLACPGNASACRSASPSAADWSCSSEISYSYQNLFARERPRWMDETSMVVLADRSPVAVRAMQGQWFNPIANSDNHQGRGQNALFTDGSVRWLRTPVLASGDNIWLSHELELLIARLKDPNQAGPMQGNESPTGKSDVFLSP